MTDSEEYQSEKNCEENATSQYCDAETEKQPLLEADQLIPGQPVQTPIPEEQPQPGSMPISPEIHPPATTTLAPESHPEPRQSRWPRLRPSPLPQHYPQAQQATTIVVTQQPSIIVPPQNVPSWIGSDGLIYCSLISTLCCGIIPGLLALFIAKEARIKKRMGHIEAAKSWSVAAIVLNILSMLVGVGALVAIGVYYGVVLSFDLYS